MGAYNSCDRYCSCPSAVSDSSAAVAIDLTGDSASAATPTGDPVGVVGSVEDGENDFYRLRFKDALECVTRVLESRGLTLCIRGTDCGCFQFAEERGAERLSSFCFGDGVGSSTSAVPEVSKHGEDFSLSRGGDGEHRAAFQSPPGSFFGGACTGGTVAGGHLVHETDNLKFMDGPPLRRSEEVFWDSFGPDRVTANQEDGL